MGENFIIINFKNWKSLSPAERIHFNYLNKKFTKKILGSQTLNLTADFLGLNGPKFELKVQGRPGRPGMAD